MDTRRSGGPFENGEVRSLLVGGPSPVALNVTAAAPSSDGWLAVYPCAGGFSGTSNVNFVTGRVVANFVVVKPDSSGRVCVKFAGVGPSTTHVIVDKYGVLSGSDFQLVDPYRIVDTRRSGGRLGAGGVKVLSGFPANSTQLLNVTVTETAAQGHITVYPCAAGQPMASSNAYFAGATKAVLTLAMADSAGKVCIYSHAGTHLVVDRFGQMQGSSVAMSTPVRLVDTRKSLGGTAGTAFRLHVPNSNGRAVALSVTTVSPVADGHITVYPCAEGKPTASMLNYVAGDLVANLAVVQPDDDEMVCFAAHTSTELVVDLYGYIGSTTTTTPTTTTTTTAPPTGLRCEQMSKTTANSWRTALGLGRLVDYPSDHLFQGGCDQLEWIITVNGGTIRHATMDHDREREILTASQGSCATTFTNAMAAWKRSPTHYNTVVEPDARYVAFACIYNPADGFSYHVGRTAVYDFTCVPPGSIFYDPCMDAEPAGRY